MNLNDIIETLGEDWRQMISVMSGALHTDVKMLEEVNSATLLHRGKLMRPMVSLLLANAVGHPTRDNHLLAAATELLHNATLMHDDVADDSNCRRGHPTLKSLVGPTAAVLIGDFWLSRAVELVLETGCHEKVEKLFTRTLMDLSEGEMFQLEKSMAADTTQEDYLRIVRCKTASLFMAACVSSVLASGGSPRQVDAALRYGESLGIAFQIKDDILDYVGGLETGKPAGLDLREGKITLPLLGAIRNYDDATSIRKMVRDAASDPGKGEYLRTFVLEHGGVEYAASCLDEYVNSAVESLSAFEDGWAVDYLAQIARYNTFRKS